MQVGNAFVGQYYNVLHQSPQVVHLFYTDANHLTHAEAGPDGVVDTRCMHISTRKAFSGIRFVSLFIHGFQFPNCFHSCFLLIHWFHAGNPQ